MLNGRSSRDSTTPETNEEDSSENERVVDSPQFLTTAVIDIASTTTPPPSTDSPKLVMRLNKMGEPDIPVSPLPQIVSPAHTLSPNR